MPPFDSNASFSSSITPKNGGQGFVVVDPCHPLGIDLQAFPGSSLLAIESLPMSDEDDNLFAGSDDEKSDDTAELLQQSSKKKPPPAARKKKAVQEEEDDDDDLFDSDSEDEAPSAKKAPPPAAAARKPMSKRERLEALAKRKRHDVEPSPNKDLADDSAPKKNKDGAEKKDGYESENSVDSADYVRTREDDAFIDTTGEDDEAIKELYAEQHFDNVNKDDMEDLGKKKRKNYGGRDRDDDGIGGGKDLDNPIVAAVHRLKRKKQEKKSLGEIEDEIKTFLGQMELAAEQDEQAVAERRPATKKLSMLSEVLEMLKKQDYQTHMIDLDLLTVIRRWIQPLPNGQLGNVTVRSKLLDAIANMPGIHPNALKRSELGKTVMTLHKHPKETPNMKRQTRGLIEQWSRGIFQKSGNMRDLEHVHHSRGEGGLASLRRQQQAAGAAASANPASRRDKPTDLKSIIASGKRGSDTGPASANRVRVPFSKGFAFSVRPMGKAGDVADTRRSPAKDKRGGLTKRMVEKSRKVGKNQRSANISVEGRRTKG
jgi:transcription factor SPN1